MHLKIVNYKFCTGRGQNKFKKVCPIHFIIYISIGYVQTNQCVAFGSIQYTSTYKTLGLNNYSDYYSVFLMMSSWCNHSIYSRALLFAFLDYILFHYSTNLVKSTTVTISIIKWYQLRENTKYRILIKFLEREGFNLVGMNLSFIHLHVYEYC